MNGRRVDHAGLQVIDRDVCLELMTRVPIGRLVFNEGGLPAVQPVTFALDDHSVVFCTSDGRKTLAAKRHDIVGFQVDAFDINSHLGWSVTAIGHLSPITDPAELTRAHRLPRTAERAVRLLRWRAGARTACRQRRCRRGPR